MAVSCNFNPNLVTLKKLVILLPGAFFGTFIINQVTCSLFFAVLIFNYVLIHIQEISNQVTWSPSVMKVTLEVQMSIRLSVIKTSIKSIK